MTVCKNCGKDVEMEYSELSRGFYCPDCYEDVTEKEQIEECFENMDDDTVEKFLDKIKNELINVYEDIDIAYNNDECEVQEAFNNLTDCMCKDNEIPEYIYNNTIIGAEKSNWGNNHVYLECNSVVVLCKD